MDMAGRATQYPTRLEVRMSRAQRRLFDGAAAARGVDVSELLRQVAPVVAGWAAAGDAALSAEARWRCPCGRVYRFEAFEADEPR